MPPRRMALGRELAAQLQVALVAHGAERGIEAGEPLQQLAQARALTERSGWPTIRGARRSR